MCTKPIRIINKNKYLNNKYGQQYYIWVNCGHCEECLREKQNEWTLRTYYEVNNTLKTKGHFVYFDTLTYDNKHLPRLNRITNIIEPTYNYPCFDYRDIREFYETLRGIYKNKPYKCKDSEIRYFITSEYGELRGRNHYHIMLFINTDKIDPIELSKNVYKAWGKGRTDGYPYRTQKYILEHNYITEMNINAIRYISKYITKPQIWMKEVNNRWNKIEHYYRERKKYKEIEIKKLKKQYLRYCTPFHRQSQGYGLDAINYQTYEDIWNNSRMKYKDDSLKIYKYASLPMYFKRKLFEEQITVNGKKIWQLNELGIKWKQQREEKILQKITDRLNNLNCKEKILNENEIKELAKYILNKRGRTKGTPDYKKHIDDTEAYNYNTDKDLIYLGKKIISKTFAGNDSIGYCTTNTKIINEWENNIYIDAEKEAIIDHLMQNKDTIPLSIQKEHMRQIKKFFFKKC